MRHQNYFKDLIGKHPVFRCCECAWDGFAESNALQHSTLHEAKEMPVESLPHNEWLKDEMRQWKLKDIGITIGLLTWNTREASRFAAISVVEEINRLRKFGARAKYCWVDNGSSDGTVKELKEIFDGVPGSRHLGKENRGQCASRNEYIYDALEDDHEYLIMVDGDTELIPYSTYAMAVFMERMDRTVGCFGLDSSNSTATGDSQVAEHMREVEDWMVQCHKEMAWTQYGIFRTEMFMLNLRYKKPGIRFDEADCFLGPGWGLDDNDIFLQMHASGYKSLSTPYFRYMHRYRHSSMAHMDPSLLNKNFQERCRYMVTKWKDHPSKVVVDHVNRLANATLPML